MSTVEQDVLSIASRFKFPIWIELNYIFLGVGERTREGNDLYHEMIDSGVIKTDGEGSKAALVYGQMNEPPGARARVALTGLTVDEYFRHCLL